MTGRPRKRPTDGAASFGESSLSARLTAITRELGRNPDSPASLAILSSVKQAMRPMQQANEQLVAALADRLQHPGDAHAQSAVTAALSHWERTSGSAMGEQLLVQFEEAALGLLRRRSQQPPALESIVQGVEGRSDVGYDLGVHLHGLRGAWHRLWAMLTLEHSWGDLGADGHERGSAEVQRQFEQLLGRKLTEVEWQKLDEHARARAADMQPPGKEPSAPHG